MRSLISKSLLRRQDPYEDKGEVELEQFQENEQPEEQEHEA